MDFLGSNKNNLNPLKNPFQKNCIEGVHIHMFTGFRGKKYWKASVEFKNGNSKGEQEFESLDFENGFSIITKEMQDFINTL